MQYNKFLVLKNADILSALSDEELEVLNSFIDKIKIHRVYTGRTAVRQYVVVSEKDTPLFDKTCTLIKEHYGEV